MVSLSSLSVSLSVSQLSGLYTSPQLPRFGNRSSLIITSSSANRSKDAASSEASRKELFDRYGLDLNDYLPKPPSKRKKRMENGKEVGREKQVVEYEPKPPRTTHKLLQVLGGKAKRKKLLSPVGMDVRPMMEVVKGSAFDILQHASIDIRLSLKRRALDEALFKSLWCTLGAPFR
ncbi:hypothetical protein KSS87_001068 [Heliosperma pusillum]|nr:hypothetical protein KSS87_001068 [Heliosperma pusillum]